MATVQKIPTEMRAAALDHFGPPNVVHIETLPVPELGRKDVLVHVVTAGVGTWDPELASGAFEDVKAAIASLLERLKQLQSRRGKPREGEEEAEKRWPADLNTPAEESTRG